MRPRKGRSAHSSRKRQTRIAFHEENNTFHIENKLLIFDIIYKHDNNVLNHVQSDVRVIPEITVNHQSAHN